MEVRQEGCPFCGKDAGGNRFCPHCGGEMPSRPAPGAPGPATPVQPTVISPVPVLPEPVLSGPAPPPTGGIGATKRNRNLALPIALGVLALVAIAGVVITVVLVSGGGVTISIKSPADGSTTAGNAVTVELDVKGQSRVAKVDVFLDSKKRATIESAPFETDLLSLEKGEHTLKATAYDSGGAVLGEATSSFQSEGAAEGNDQTNGDKGSAAYMSSLAAKINEASLLDARITTMANRINSEVNFNTRSVPAGLLADTRALVGSANTLADSAAALDPPADMKGIQAEFLVLLGYLQARADALLGGLQAVSSGGDYKASFDKGGAAKSSFDKAWPGFKAECKSFGVPI